MNAVDPNHFVTIEHFVQEILGLKNRSWYYKHHADPGVPQRVMVGGKPMLSYRECLAYVDLLVARRELPPPEPAPQPPVKRHPGRPAKPSYSREERAALRRSAAAKT